ncbi:MAG: hypothetical protein AAF281_13030 [Pseudomonadota bacterium]
MTLKGPRRTVGWRSYMPSTVLYGSHVIFRMIDALTSTSRQTVGTVRRGPGAAARLVPGWLLKPL